MPRCRKRTRTARKPAVVVNEDPKPHAFEWAGLPEELKAQVYSYLGPTDLLNFARTNKGNHHSLRTRRHALDWQRARENVEGFPPCPSWQSEMQFASLVSDACCVVCLKEDACSRLPIWPFHTRYCLACEVAYTIVEDPFAGLPEGAYKNLFPTQDLIPSYRQTVAQGEARIAYHRPDVARFREAIVKADDTERAGIVLQQHAYTRERYEHAKLCEKWQQKMKELEAARKEEIELARYLEIESRIDALGYDREWTNMGLGLEGLSVGLRNLVEKPEPLCESEWRKMLPGLKAALDQARTFEERRLDVQLMLTRLRDLDDAIEDYVRSQPARDDNVWPRALDLVDLPEAAFYIQIHRTVTIPQGTYDTIVPDLIMQWREQREGVLLARLPAIGDQAPQLRPGRNSIPPTTSAIITRAMSSRPSLLTSSLALFWCSGCRKLVSGVQAMHHHCCYDTFGGWGTLHPPCIPWLSGQYTRLVTEGVDMFKRTSVVYNHGLMQWSPDVLRGCSETVRAVWAAAELRPEEKVEQARLACSSCSVVDKVMVVMGWRAATHHVFDVHGGDRVRWIKVCPQVSAKAKLIEYTCRDETDRQTRLRRRWYCERCPWPHSQVTYEYLDLVEHCNTEHSVLFPGDHHSLSDDCPEYMHPPVVLSETHLPDGSMPTVIGALLALRGNYRYAEMRFPKQAWAGFMDE